MSALGILLVSFTPGLFWLWFFVRLDRIRPSSRRWLALTFIFGMVSTIPAGIISELAIQDDLLSASTTLASVSLAMLAVVGPVEETSKFLAIRLTVYRSLFFEEPMDGLVYGAAASLGFASLGKSPLRALPWAGGNDCPGPIQHRRAPCIRVPVGVWAGAAPHGTRPMGRLVRPSRRRSPPWRFQYSALQLRSMARVNFERSRRRRGLPTVQVGATGLPIPLPSQCPPHPVPQLRQSHQSSQHVLPSVRSSSDRG